MSTSLPARPSATEPQPSRLQPTRIAPETFLIHADHGGGGPVEVALNTMVIRAAEPVVVDTGMPQNREQFLHDVFSLVEPEDIRWVFISHDDVDHTGNLNALMAAAPNAVAVINWFMTQRMSHTLEVPPTRQRWVGDGESIEVGDRTLLAVRPPVFDAPTTRGLFDPTTGVYWSSDGFATPMDRPVADVSELPAEMWSHGMNTFDRYISPWLTLCDDARFQRTVDRIEALRPTVMAGCHTPAITGGHVAAAVESTRRSPTATIDPEPDQALLDEIVGALEGVAA